MVETYQRLKSLGNHYQELLEEVAVSNSAEGRMQLLHQIPIVLDDLEELILKTLRDDSEREVARKIQAQRKVARLAGSA